MKRVSENPKVFALSTLTHTLEKTPRDDDGNIINPDFNAKMYVKKAYAAYNKGLDYFKYKGEVYVVPRFTKANKAEALDMVEKYMLQEEEEVININNIENKKAW